MFFIKEIFKSIQGEGFFSGKSAVFVRFTGCNLWNGLEKDRENAQCKFCDTDFLGINGINGGAYSLNDLLDKIDKIWSQKTKINTKFIVLTGGEPMLQVNKKLVESLKNRGYFVSLETNGTIRFNIDFDWVCVSPKAGNTLIQVYGDELKLVYPQKNIVPDIYEKYSFKNFSLQPMDGELKVHNTNLTLKYCMKNPIWRVSIQTHKIIGIR